MKAVDLVTNFVAPALFYMSILLYFMSGLALLGAFYADPSFLIVGLVMFILAYNSWFFGKRARSEVDAPKKKK